MWCFCGLFEMLWPGTLTRLCVWRFQCMLLLFNIDYSLCILHSLCWKRSTFQRCKAQQSHFKHATVWSYCEHIASSETKSTSFFIVHFRFKSWKARKALISSTFGVDWIFFFWFFLLRLFVGSIVCMCKQDFALNSIRVDFKWSFWRLQQIPFDVGYGKIEKYMYINSNNNTHIRNHLYKYGGGTK